MKSPLGFTKYKINIFTLRRPLCRYLTLLVCLFVLQETKHTRTSFRISHTWPPTTPTSWTATSSTTTKDPNEGAGGQRSPSRTLFPSCGVAKRRSWSVAPPSGMRHQDSRGWRFVSSSFSPLCPLHPLLFLLPHLLLFLLPFGENHKHLVRGALCVVMSLDPQQDLSWYVNGTEASERTSDVRKIKGFIDAVWM